MNGALSSRLRKIFTQPSTACRGTWAARARPCSQRASLHAWCSPGLRRRPARPAQGHFHASGLTPCPGVPFREPHVVCEKKEALVEARRPLPSQPFCWALQSPRLRRLRAPRSSLGGPASPEAVPGTISLPGLSGCGWAFCRALVTRAQLGPAGFNHTARDSPQTRTCPALPAWHSPQTQILGTVCLLSGVPRTLCSLACPLPALPSAWMPCPG